MTQEIEPTQSLAQSSALEDWINRQTWRFAKHWLLVINAFMALFIGLPYLAPILAHYGFNSAALVIYRAYRVTCHQQPERSFHIFGYQAALCHRCTAIWLSFFLGGLIFILLRHRLRGLPFHWWILAMIPVGLDGGTQLIGPVYELLNPWFLTGFAIIVWLVLTVVMYKQGVRNWQYYLFVLCFPLGMGYVHLTGVRLSNWHLRSITGAILGFSYVWLIFPMMEEAFKDWYQGLSERFGYVDLQE